MKDVKILCVLLGGAVISQFALADPATNLLRPEPNAFLNRPASTMQDMIQQIRTDPEVYSRFNKHFGMGKTELISYFATLKPAKLSRDGLYTVYNVHDDGVIRSKLFSLKAGSLIYIDSFGQAVLKKVCGNPMARRPTNLSVASMVPAVPTGATAEFRPITEESPMAQTPIEMMVVEEVVMPAFVPEVVITPPVTPPTIVTPETPVVKPSFESIPIASILPLLAGAAILAPGSSNGPPVPEPATIAVMAGLIGLYGANRARRRAK